jgi:hypothetical protein
MVHSARGGDLFVANANKGTISEVSSLGVVSTFASGFTSPDGLAFNGAGDLFVSNSNGTIDKITPSGVVSTFVTGLQAPAGLAFEAGLNSSPSLDEKHSSDGDGRNK